MEAKEFHSFFVSGFIGFTCVAIVAHFLAWQWRPWLPSATGYKTSLIDGAQGLVTQAMTLIG
jgi:light-harvesting complex 1 beta chain